MRSRKNWEKKASVCTLFTHGSSHSVSGGVLCWKEEITKVYTFRGVCCKQRKQLCCCWQPRRHFLKISKTKSLKIGCANKGEPVWPDRLKCCADFECSFRSLPRCQSCQRRMAARATDQLKRSTTIFAEHLTLPTFLATCSEHWVKCYTWRMRAALTAVQGNKQQHQLQRTRLKKKMMKGKVRRKEDRQRR